MFSPAIRLFVYLIESFHRTNLIDLSRVSFSFMGYTLAVELIKLMPICYINRALFKKNFVEKAIRYNLTIFELHWNMLSNEFDWINSSLV